MPTKLDVVNQTLNELGRLPVTNLNDSQDSQLISNKLDILLPQMLTRTDWNFAIKFVEDDNPLSQTFSPDFVYSYQLPADFGRMDRFSPDAVNFGFYFRLIDGLLATNSKPVKYYYVVNNVDYDVLPPNFYRALVLYAASTSCLTLTQDQSLKRELMQEYKDMLMGAILENNMERYVQSTPFNDFDRQVFV